MKVILTGATGFIGGEVLKQCLSHPSITKILAITRRALPEPLASDPKVKSVILEDFTSYPPAILEQLSGADACIWALGLARGDPAQAKQVNMDFTMAGANAIAASVASASKDEKGKKFHFVYVSGMFTERNQEANLWFMSDFRRMRGEVENQLLSLQKKHEKDMEVFITKPGGVVRNMLARAVMPKGMVIGVDELAAALIAVAVSGHEEQTLENAGLTAKGRAASRSD